ncbi:MAG: single-stranded DNA-binding protein [Oscillospiraceae bacterium]|nr:single-stranded DNA-binding protein [Oscillospiraceae bacterium]
MDENVQYALEEFEKINADEIFLVKDLWKGYEWYRKPVVERLQIGRLFYNALMRQTPCPVDVLEKTDDEQQKYRKKR